MRERAEIHLEKVPEPGTEDMVRLLHDILESVLQQLPFPFTTGDVMSATSALLIDAGMVAVMEGNETKEGLTGEVCKVISDSIEAWDRAASNMTSDAIRSRTVQ